MTEMTDVKPHSEAYASLDGTQAMFRHMEKRLTSLELSMATLETERAVSEERQRFMEMRFNHIDRRLEKIDGHISRLIWAIIASIVGGVIHGLLTNGLFGL
ncbi:MAG: hypothetical protein AAF686_04445 [Pseudomonadota bacterium]